MSEAIHSIEDYNYKTLIVHMMTTDNDVRVHAVRCETKLS